MVRWREASGRIPAQSGGAGDSPSFHQSLTTRTGYEPAMRLPENTFYDTVKAWRAENREQNVASLTRALTQPAAKAAILKTAAFADNGLLVNNCMGDCVTCHFSTTIRYLSREKDSVHPVSRAIYLGPVEAAKVERKVFDTDYFTTLDLPERVEARAIVREPALFPEYNLRNFGYFFHRPVVSQRVANDTALSVDYLSRQTD